MVLHVRGSGAEEAFEHEAGGHRYQRVPPTERRDRVHTSTVTVAVLNEPREGQLQIDPEDLEWRFIRGSGAGGQHRNNTRSAVDLVHKPTGVVVHCESERSQLQNRASAMAVLRARLIERQNKLENEVREKTRRTQVGSGMRGDKRRTIRFQDGTVVDHVTGRSWELRKYLRGDW
ncbi:MAG: peptide chain release factor-like protein [Polyangiales bacterium]